MLYVLLALNGVAVVLLVVLLVLLVRSRGAGVGRELERRVGEELRAGREEQTGAARALREELGTLSRAGQETLAGQLRESREAMHAALTEIGMAQQRHLLNVERRLGELTESSAKQHEQLRERLGVHLKQLQEGNEKKLEEMRLTVDEKLHGTLEKRLGESFALVSERLEAVQRGLGEMQSLASGVGDLKRALTNVKVRGVWGEYQLGAILEQILTPDQYVANYRPREDSGDVVEFAIRLPGRAPDGAPVYLPIDSKFPQEDYHRLADAAERADAEALRAATAALVRAARQCARDICDKYVHPPATTDFAIMFLPTEGLYAELLRQPGLVQQLQAECQVVLAGPTTLAAILSSFRMGFRTLAIEQRSSEVWEVLGAVKSEFGKFGMVLDKVKKQLGTATRTIDQAKVRTRAMERKLREVEELPADEALRVLEMDPAAGLLAGDGNGSEPAAPQGDGDGVA